MQVWQRAARRRIAARSGAMTSHSPACEPLPRTLAKSKSPCRGHARLSRHPCRGAPASATGSACALASVGLVPSGHGSHQLALQSQCRTPAQDHEDARGDIPIEV